ncbi:hypothetical protein NOF04DRAFT_9716 [Fusarium oxysporum II5]|uniref:G domain-containing protein n=2 Tax=Fusarium oxysporum species complex TaxID=171631 RepID=X0JJC6_FUSO5|nr:uncharacterized protein FOIG_11379 [Fusarium odoratissimum NRRL 54006]EXL96425.1 hypothetical protein FOIG_11379 [Fusarium odoratissimum NRRL 54006]KAK2125607.1 hypothetical protein NOF04DRAFT_9716 [Fusarium oxysporum II5]TXB99696.1 hypothetical protein FocTR4_00013781 [Fusarium oxysporum f. sp. cubense]
MAEIVRPALGQQVAIGTLYDARVDQFLQSSILPPNLPRGIVLRGILPPSDQLQNWMAEGSDHASRFRAMCVDDNLAASILSGSIDLEGSANFLKDSTVDENTLCGAVRHFFNTYKDVLDINRGAFRTGGAPAMFLPPDPRSTHVVTSVRWGLQSILTMKHRIADPSQQVALELSFQRDLMELNAIVNSIYSLDFSKDLASQRLELDYEFKLYTDIQRDRGICKETLPVMCRFVQLGPQQITHTPDEAGYPMEYTLHPIQVLRHLMTGGGPHQALRAITNIDPFFVLFDDWNACTEKLEEYRHSLVGREQYLARSHIDEVDASIALLETSRKNLQMTLQRTVASIKDGTVHEHRLEYLYADHELSARQISMIAGQQSDKLRFIEQCLNSGATYIGFNGACINERTLSHDPPPYHFLFNNAVLKSSSSWNEHCTTLREFLHNPQTQNQVFIVDCDAPSEYRELEAPIFGPIRTMSKPVIEVSEYRDTSAERRPPTRQAEHRQQPQRCIARCDPGEMDFDTRRPAERRLVRIPCPGPSCDSHLSREWACASCNTPLEFGSTNNCIYCDCGSAAYDSWDFKCNSDSHGRGFDRYHTDELYRLLTRSKRPDCRNILVLGQTGVGKSTFINSFVNFLTFESFDEAKSALKLEYKVPCSFSVSHWNSSDLDQELESRTIRVGSGDDEHDGTTGDSATQRTSVYRVTYNDTKYRIIDTPGIGDTRGPETDNKNIKDIMNTLKRYKELHGILILLNTNEARLTATINFCFGELLSHLHRSAVANVVFGFTHTLISNYAPGDALKPLQSYLKNNTTVDLTVCRANSYSFDAKSFHYLAAYFQGVRGEDERSSRESWDKSRAETLRLLSYIDNFRPHEIRQTLTMEGAREALCHLMIPMVEISQEIKKNLSLLEEKMAELKDMRLTGDELRKKLHLERIKVVPTKLDKPRTVCKNKHCCEFKSDSNGEVVPFYKSICHEDCRLPGVTEECLGHPELIKCRAFKDTKDKTCKICKHSWQEHMHFFYELTESKVKVKDKDVERRLRDNASDMALRQEGIERVQQLEKEYRSEQKQLRKATAQFVAYLREHSANAFNDATEKYYDQLIKIEIGKIQFGKDNRLNVDANKTKLKGLTDDRDRHLELVKTIQENMHAPRDQTEALLTQDGVEQLIRDLYNLKHFGKNLRSLRDDITHYKNHGKRSHHRHRSRSRRSERSLETREDVSDRSSRSHDEREQESGRNRDILRGIHKFLSDI